MKVTDSVVEAVAEVCRFYRTYHSLRFVGSRLVMRLNRDVGEEELMLLNQDFADIVEKGDIERIDPTEAEVRDGDALDRHRIAFRFNRHHWSRLRMLIDRLNAP